jgi:hypothetical protein
VTLESFKEWKRSRIERKEAEEREAQEKKAAAYRAGGKNLVVSGRELFMFNPDLLDVDDDDDEGGHIDYSQYRREEDEGNSQTASVSGTRDIKEDLFEGEDLENLDIDDDDEEE